MLKGEILPFPLGQGGACEVIGNQQSQEIATTKAGGTKRRDVTRGWRGSHPVEAEALVCGGPHTERQGGSLWPLTSSLSLLCFPGEGKAVLLRLWQQDVDAAQRGQHRSLTNRVRPHLLSHSGSPVYILRLLPLGLSQVCNPSPWLHVATEQFIPKAIS